MEQIIRSLHFKVMR